MSLLAERFATCKRRNRRGFIPFIVAGDPDLDTTEALLAGLNDLQPVAIEVGVPFSDPTADGPVIQRASQRAVANGTNLSCVMAIIQRWRSPVSSPAVLFSYYNPILQFGIEKFARAAARAGVAGVLAVDLPAEAAVSLHDSLRAHDIDLILLVAPTTSDERLKKIVSLASGFIYAVGRTGVTGTSRGVANESRQLVSRIKLMTDLPVAVGFGIASRQRAREVCRYADAAVVGSRLVEEIEAVMAQPNYSQAAVVQQVVARARAFI